MTLTATAKTMHSKQAHYDESLAKNGRTFHWARRFLGQEHGANAARLYAFCRLLDDLADGDLPFGKSRLLTISEDLTRLSLLPDSYANDPDMAEFAPFMQQMALPPIALRHLIDGLTFDQGQVALQSESDLIIYGYQVAGTVGMMMCPILNCHDKLASAFAIDLGIAMQLTNIARDVLEDAKMGRRYLPGNWLENVTPDEIAQGAASQNLDIMRLVQHALERTLRLADTYYASGLKGLAFLPKRAQIAIAVAAYSYREIGMQLQGNNLNWHEGRTVTSTKTKARASLPALRYILPLSSPQTHDSQLHTALRGYAV